MNRRTRLSIAFAAAGVLGASVLPTAAADGGKPGIVWMDDFGAAMEKAGKENRPLLVDFYTDWCLYCGKLEKETLSDPRIVGLSKEFVCVRLDAEVHKGVAARYSPQGFPTIILATPTGDELLRVSGFRDADSFHKVLKATHDKAPQMTEDLARIKKDSGDFAAREDLGNIYLDLGLADPAVDQLRAALKAVPRVPAQAGRESDAERIEARLGRAQLLAKDYGAAAKTFVKLVDANPGAPHAPDWLLELARTYAASGKTKKVNEVATRIERDFPGSPQAEAVRGTR